MDNLIKGIQHCECGKNFEWYFILKESGAYYFGNPLEWFKNVLNYTDIGDSYAVSTQCPHCNRRTSTTHTK